MKRGRHIPLRSCVGCGQRAPKSELIRFVYGHAGLEADPTGNRAGRGAYLHRDLACWQAFEARKGPVRSLRRSAARAQREALVRQLQTAGGQPNTL
jgi:predicted RNA-binding protein YlxR (DUF448 family)